MRILVLGATGFLGGLVARRLVREGHEVVCLARGASVESPDPSIRYVQATLDDADAIAEHAVDADYLLHFAWDTTPGTSKGQPTIETVNNLLPTFRLIEQLQSISKCQLVFISSAGAVYDESGTTVANESSALNPKSYYGAGKLAAEMFLRAFCSQTGVPVVIARPTNVYGPGQRVKRQFAIVPTLMQAVRNGSRFTIWGSGDAQRDYLYSEDFAEFFVSLTERQWLGFNVFNLSSNRSCSVIELCRLVEKVSGKELALEYLPDRGVDLQGIEIDSSLAKAELGWQAATDLEQGLANTWEWFARRE